MNPSSWQILKSIHIFFLFPSKDPPVDIKYTRPMMCGKPLKVLFCTLTQYSLLLAYLYSNLADCKQRVTQYMVPFVTHTRTKETKPVVAGQVQGYAISSMIFCDTEMTLPYWFLRYHSLVPINEQDLREQLL